MGGAYLSEKTLLKWKNWIVGEKEALKAKRADSEFTLPAMLEDRVFEMMASTQEQAFFELAQTMVKRKIITETSEITFALSEREILGSTYIGKGIAIPHCRIPEIDYPHLACGLLNNSIDWKSPTGEKVNLLFLILTPENKPEQHLKAVRAIAAEIQKHEDLYQDIKTAMVNGKLGTLFSE